MIKECAILGVYGVKSVSLSSRAEIKKRSSASLRRSPLGAAIRSRKQKAAAEAEVYLVERTPVDFYSFDEEYLRRLGARDPATEAHFVAYFSERLRITLRARGVDSHTIEDVRQETFCRVWVAVQSGNVNNPRGFGSYVHSVCKHVLSKAAGRTIATSMIPWNSRMLPMSIWAWKKSSSGGNTGNWCEPSFPNFLKGTGIFYARVSLMNVIMTMFAMILEWTAIIFAFCFTGPLISSGSFTRKEAINAVNTILTAQKDPEVDYDRTSDGPRRSNQKFYGGTLSAR